MAAVIGRRQRAVHETVARADSGGANDEALVAAAQLDRTAFGPLYERYVDAVFRFCYRRLGNRVAAEDATSRVFERTLTALSNYRDGPFRPWLFAIARNVVVDHHRASRANQTLDVAAAIVDDRPGPEETMLRRAESARIFDLLVHLTPDQHQIVELRLAGLTDREIASVLGRSHGSVRTAQYRALQRLRTLINQLDQQEERHATRHR